MKSKIKNRSFSATIPVIDMNDFYNHHHHLFIKKLQNAFTKVGFVGIINTPIDQQLLIDVYHSAKIFFELDEFNKNQIFDPTNSGERGYVGTSESPVGKDLHVRDKKEFLHFGRELDYDQQKRLGYPQNIWPTQVNLKTPVMLLYESFASLIEPLSAAIEEAVYAPQNYLQKMLAEGDHLFRIVRYPKSLLIGEEGAAAHTDSNLFTLLPPATSEGLEVMLNRQWLPVIVPSNAVIVNIGSMLEHMTNGFFRAAIHRVVKQQENNYDRYSIAFFAHSRENDPMDPLPSCIKMTGGEQRFPEATRQELLDLRLIAMNRATEDKIKNFADSGLVDRWENFLTCDDQRQNILHELEKVAQLLNKPLTHEIYKK
jgi:isopenicillin N synthase-like dioxygenase